MQLQQLPFGAAGDFALHSPSYRAMIFSDPSIEKRTVTLYNSHTVDLQNLPSGFSDFVDWSRTGFKQLADQLERPWLHINGDFFVHCEWRLTPEELAAMRLRGINIFFYEPLFIHNADMTWPWMPNRGPARYLDLEKIAQFFQRWGIHSITVFLCEQGMADILTEQKLFPQLVFKDWSSYFLEVVCRERALAAPALRPLKKKFMNLNFRYESVRELLAAFLVGKGYRDDSHISFYHLHDRRELLHRLPFDPLQLRQWPTLEQGLRVMQDRLPFTVEATNPLAVEPAVTAIPDFDGLHNQRSFSEIRDLYAPESFLFLYSESRPFSPCSDVSEKTLIPIFMGKPILPFAAPHFLKSLRKLGFMTFGAHWDESFDDIEDPLRRFQAYLETVQSLGELPMREILALQEKIRPLLDHNRDWAQNHVATQEQRRLISFVQDSPTSR